jgi:hypothetical protein
VRQRIVDRTASALSAGVCLESRHLSVIEPATDREIARRFSEVKFKQVADLVYCATPRTRRGVVAHNDLENTRKYKQLKTIKPANTAISGFKLAPVEVLGLYFSSRDALSPSARPPRA